MVQIKRIDTYSDDRFSQEALYQHGCFLIDDLPFEIKIISSKEAVIYGKEKSLYPELIDEFRFYSPQITIFKDTNDILIKNFAEPEQLSVLLNEIQPSQFYVDKEKLNAIKTFIQKQDDIVIQAGKSQTGYIALDGHTSLYLAVLNGWIKVNAVIVPIDNDMFEFVKEAKRRGVQSVRDMILLNHDDYVVKWHRFCDAYFDEKQISTPQSN